MNRRTSKEREKWRRRVLKMKYSPADVVSKISTFQRLVQALKPIDVDFLERM